MKITLLNLALIFAMILHGDLLAAETPAGSPPPPTVYEEWSGNGLAYRDQQLQKTIRYFEKVQQWISQGPEDWQALMAKLQPQGLTGLQDDIDALKAAVASSPLSSPAPIDLSENNLGDPSLKVRLNYAELNQRFRDLAEDDGKFQVCFSSFTPPYISYVLHYGLAQLDPHSEAYKTKAKLLKRYEKEVEHKQKKKIGPTCCTLERPPQFVFAEDKVQVVVPCKTSCKNLGFQIMRYNVSLPSVAIDIFPENPPEGPSYLSFKVHTKSGFSVKASIMESILNGKEVKSAVASLFPFFQATKMTCHEQDWEIEFAKNDKPKLASVLEFFALRRIINDCFGAAKAN